MTPQFIEYVVKSAPLHDTGKIKISDAILNKPGRFTPEEYEIMKKHAVYGKEIIDKAISTVEGESYLREAGNMAGYHHERAIPDESHILPGSFTLMFRNLSLSSADTLPPSLSVSSLTTASPSPVPPLFLDESPV